MCVATHDYFRPFVLILYSLEIPRQWGSLEFSNTFLKVPCFFMWFDTCCIILPLLDPNSYSPVYETVMLSEAMYSVPLLEPEGSRQWPDSTPLRLPAGVWLRGRRLWRRKHLHSELLEQRRPGLQLPQWMGSPLQETGRHVRRRRRWWHAVNLPKRT